MLSVGGAPGRLTPSCLTARIYDSEDPPVAKAYPCVAVRQHPGHGSRVRPRCIPTGASISNPIGAAFLLAVEAQKVIELRLVLIAWGGAEAQAEMVSMVGEKVVAAMEAANTLLAVGTHGQVWARYRELVADSARRLAA